MFEGCDASRKILSRGPEVVRAQSGENRQIKRSICGERFKLGGGNSKSTRGQLSYFSRRRPQALHAGKKSGHRPTGPEDGPSEDQGAKAEKLPWSVRRLKMKKEDEK